ncbi:MAG: hypothetical protein CL840_18660 [Crocinitomicaceae bacterium]|nr:hypothetical protein [Crocinitomicaceae bacterium]|tara:strand:+ start:5637 stop:6146 length:510 start_codon:yes stop_codon:yes gene_type:complete
MEKRLGISLLCCVVFAFFLEKQVVAQSKLEVISTAGQQFSNSTYAVTWTVGEPIIKTIGNQTHFMTQGFNQYEWVIVGVWNYIPADLSVEVYPNPTSRNLNVSFEGLEELNDQYRVVIYDMLYKPVFTQAIESDLESYDLSELSNGTYLVHIMDETGNFLKTFKVLKNR